MLGLEESAVDVVFDKCFPGVCVGARVVLDKCVLGLCVWWDGVYVE